MPSLVLTPHALSPLPDDGCLPDDLVILRAGLYNLGFAALRDTPRVRFLLQWWDHKLRTLCLEDVHTGVFTDQKWMDYAPLLVPGTTVLRHMGFNAAYWNLHERAPYWLDGRWRMQGQAGDVQDLVFFHFSGFNPDLKQPRATRAASAGTCPATRDACSASMRSRCWTPAFTNSARSAFRRSPLPMAPAGTGYAVRCTVSRSRKVWAWVTRWKTQRSFIGRQARRRAIT